MTTSILARSKLVPTASNSGIENWFETKILTAVYTVLSTMALGFGFVYVVYITARLTGMIGKIKAIKDPRKNI